MKVDIVKFQPRNVFNLFFLTQELISVMVNKTNKYAEQELNKTRPLRQSPHFRKRASADGNKMKLCLGILPHMGQVRLQTMEHYWSSTFIYKFPSFSNIISRNKFQLLLRFSYFSDNEAIKKGRLSKVKLLLDHLHDIIKEIYVPDKDLSLDESMMLRRWRLVFKQYIKNKKHKYGVKFYDLCESYGTLAMTNCFLMLKKMLSTILHHTYFFTGKFKCSSGSTKKFS